MGRIDPMLMLFLLLVVLLIWKWIESTSGNVRERKPEALRFVVRCAFGYYGPDCAHPGANRGDLPLKDAYRYTRREARDMADQLGAMVEDLGANEPGFVVHCSYGYYGVDKKHPHTIRRDLPLKDAYRYTQEDAQMLAVLGKGLGAKVEEVRS